MTKLIGASALALVMAMGGAALAQSGTSGTSGMSGKSGTSATTGSGMTKMSQSECESVWSRLDASKSGKVSEAQAQTYVTDFKSVDTNNDGQLSRAEFLAGCDKGMVKSAAAGTGSSMGGSSATGTGSSSSTMGAGSSPSGTSKSSSGR